VDGPHRCFCRFLGFGRGAPRAYRSRIPEVQIFREPAAPLRTSSRLRGVGAISSRALELVLALEWAASSNFGRCAFDAAMRWADD